MSARRIPSAESSKFFIQMAILLCVLTVVSVIVLAVVVPDNPAVVATVLGITTPLTMALMAAGLHGMATNINGKMTELLAETAEKERLRGLLEGLKENPKINIT